VPVGASTSKFWYDESPHAPHVKPELGDVVGGGACARVGSGAHSRRAAKEDRVCSVSMGSVYCVCRKSAGRRVRAA